jgi:hypothetical protein
VGEDAVRWTKHALYALAFLLMGAITLVFLNYYHRDAPPRPKRQDTRLERVCRDVALKVTMAEAWVTAGAGEEAEIGQTMLVTLAGVRAICAEVGPTE